MRIGIIGGGPAGVFAAIIAATQTPAATIEVLEATRQPLEKVLLSGGGRCNVTHHCFEPGLLVENYPRGARELRGAFSRFQPRDMVSWLAQEGVELKTEPDGRMFPVTDSSQTIVDCLLRAAQKLRVAVKLGAAVRSVAVRSDAPRFELTLRDKSQHSYDRLLLATASNRRGYEIAAALGHTIVPCVPSLFTFKIADPRLTGLAGISFENAELSLPAFSGKAFRQSGPLLITHWGLSGPAVLRLSAWGARELHDCKYRTELRVNLLPESTTESTYQELCEFREQNPRKQVHTGSRVPLPRRYWQRIVELHEIDTATTWSKLGNKAIRALATELCQGEFRIVGKGEFKEEFVTCGGVDLREVDFRTMESKLCSGLFFAGEILDIDGITGGFNFQSAWSTGWLAGRSMAG